MHKILMQLLSCNGVLASFLPFINAFRVEIFIFLIDVFIGIFGTLPVKMFGPFWSVWCKMALAEVGVSLP